MSGISIRTVTVYSAIMQLALGVITGVAQVPDLRPEISNVTIRTNETVGEADVAEGCAAATTKRTLIGFDHYAWNDGPANLTLGDPGCPDCSTPPPPICTNPLFECSLAGGHGHAHLKNFSSYTVTKKGSPTVILRGHKEGFCLVDSFCNPGIQPGSSGSCNNLTAGCADIYGNGYGCQYVDITGLSHGEYTLHVELNPLRTITELSYDNNEVTSDFKICKKQGGLSTLQVEIGLPTAQYPTKRPITISGVIEHGSPTVLKSFNPIKDGFTIKLSLDNYTVLSNVSLPSGAVGSGCFPTDGWTKLGKGQWSYRNDFEYDPSCSYPATQGLHVAQLRKVGKKLFFTIRGRVDVTSVPARPSSGRASFSWAGSSTDVTNETCGGALLLAKRCHRSVALTVCK